jgi:hypothetical protein
MVTSSPTWTEEKSVNDIRGLRLQIREPYTMNPFVLYRNHLDTELMGSGAERSTQRNCAVCR